MHRLVHHSHEDGSPYPEQECPIAESMRTREAVRVENEVLWRKDGTHVPGRVFVVADHRGGRAPRRGRHVRRYHRAPAAGAAHPGPARRQPRDGGGVLAAGSDAEDPAGDRRESRLAGGGSVEGESPARGPAGERDVARRVCRDRRFRGSHARDDAAARLRPSRARLAGRQTAVGVQSRGRPELFGASASKR